MKTHPTRAQLPLTIHFAPPGVLARRVVKRSNARKTSKYPSWKMKGMLQCESENERNCMLLLDVCSWVRSYRPQPCRITYRLDHQEHRHFPDILVETESGLEFIEVKTAANAQRLDTARRTDLLAELLPAHGYRYRVLMAEDLARNPRLQNAERIKRLGSIEVTSLQREHIRILFQQHQTLPWGGLLSDRQNPELIRQVCRLVLDGQLGIDLDQPLTADTLVSWISNSLQHGGASWESLISRKAQ